MPTLYQKLLSEFLSTTLLVLFGNSSVANQLLPRTKSTLTLGFGFISLCWGIGATVAITAFGKYGASMNPAFSLADLYLSKITFTEWILFFIFQVFGGIFASLLIYANYYSHYQVDCIPSTDLDVSITRDFLGKTEVKSYDMDGVSVKSSEDIKEFIETCKVSQAYRLMTFATKPAIPSPINAVSEFLGTLVLVVGIDVAAARMSPDLVPLIVGLYIFVLIATLGGTTGFACNPARDLGPRIAHFFLPIKGKGGSEFPYGAMVVFTNLLGGLVGGVIVKEILKALP